MSDPNAASKAKPADPKSQAPVDDDPASPSESTQESAAADSSESAALTNYGDPAVNKEFDLTAESMPDDLEATAPTLEMDIAVAHQFLQDCMTSNPRVQYGLGAKVNPHGAIPGSGFKRVDCSGFVRETIWRATTPHSKFPDGSVVQHDFIRDQGYEKSTRADAMLQDGKVRIVFLRPQDSPKNIGHVALVHNGKTLESHGSFGPNARDWTNEGWQAKAFVYILKN